MGRVLSVTLVHALTRCKERWGPENEPLFDGKELKPVELQLIVDNFKVCILSEPKLTGCERWFRVFWWRRNETGTT